MSAQKNSIKTTNQAGSSNETLSRPRSTDSIYSLPSFSMFRVGCMLYRCLHAYWNTNGKPFLQRTLLYERENESIAKRQKRKINRSLDENGRCGKRVRFDTSSLSPPSTSERSLNVSTPKKETDHKNDVVEWKPFSTKIVFEAILDQSGANDSVDVDTLTLKGNEFGLILTKTKRENGNNYSMSTLRLPRNPPTNIAGINGHVLPSITIPLDEGATSNSTTSNGFRQTALTRSSNVWLLLRCKLPLPRASPRFAQRRASASLAPSTWDYCYGCCDVGDAGLINTTGDSGNEITVFLKRLTPKHDENGNGSINDHVFGSEVFSELLADNDCEDPGSSKMPTLKLRIFQTHVQRRRHYTNCSSTSTSPCQKDTKRKRRRLSEICDKLPPDLKLLRVKKRIDFGLMPPPSKRPKTDVDSDEELDDDDQHGPRLFYQFRVEHQQQDGGTTESCVNRFTTKLRQSNRCPFCQTKFKDLYALLQHHRSGHGRWSFVLKENADGYVIEMRPALYYDERLETRVLRKRYSKRKVIPMKKIFLDTETIFYRPRNHRESVTGKRVMRRSLDEFKTCPKDVESQEAKTRSEFMLHHGRIYYHSQTCQSMLLDDFDRDSEDEMDPEWLRNQTERMLDEFTDVNQGEKSIMKMWNLHTMKNNCFGDKQMVTACDTFLIQHGRRILLDNLDHNFSLHLANLYYFGLLSQVEVYRLTKKLYSMRRPPLPTPL